METEGRGNGEERRKEIRVKGECIEGEGRRSEVKRTNEDRMKKQYVGIVSCTKITLLAKMRYLD